MARTALTTKGFINQAKKVHGDKWDYSQAKYVNARTRVTLGCPDHGFWEQLPAAHLRGQGCAKCAAIRSSQSQRLTTEQFIEKAREIHGDLYDYSRSKYVDARTPVVIGCSEHGFFKQTPANHLGNAHGCQVCGREKSTAHKLDTEEFIRRSQEVHGDKYNYSKTNYQGIDRKAKILCPKHGTFEQTPYNHMRGSGCPECANEGNGEKNRLTTEEFIKRATKVHQGKYNYDKVHYKTSVDEVKIICPVHGEFEQLPGVHLAGHGCKKCMADNSRISQKEFLDRCHEVHGDRYGYDKLDYKRGGEPITIICLEHGEFEQNAGSHMRGQGCPMCKHDSQRLDTKEFIRRAKKVHGDKYDYSPTEYQAYGDKVQVVCSEHGGFEQTPSNHLSGSGCPRCVIGQKATRIHKKVARFLGKLGVTYEENIRIPDSMYEMDIYIPSLKIGIEINGDYWHSAKVRGKYYHQMKADLAEAQGITLLQFWGSEIDGKWDLVRSMIRSKLGKLKKRVYARKLTVEEILASEAGQFLEGHHIQGAFGATVRLGLRDSEGHLMALMTLGRPRFTGDFEWELLRYCSRRNWAVVGGFSRLLKAFERKYSPASLISYANRRWSIGNVYKQNGLQKRKWNSSPSYVYTNGYDLVSRYKAQKQRLPKLLGERFDPLLTERENMLRAKYWILYDAGNLVFRKIYRK